MCIGMCGSVSRNHAHAQNHTCDIHIDAHSHPNIYSARPMSHLYSCISVLER